MMVLLCNKKFKVNETEYTCDNITEHAGAHSFELSRTYIRSDGIVIVENLQPKLYSVVDKAK